MNLPRFLRAALSLGVNFATGAPLDAAPVFTSLNVFEAVVAEQRRAQTRIAK